MISGMALEWIVGTFALAAVAVVALGWWAFRGLPTGNDYYREIDRRRDGRHDAGTGARK